MLTPDGYAIYASWRLTGVLFVGLFAFVAFAQVYLHECGHYLVGKAFGLPGGCIRLAPVDGQSRWNLFPQAYFDSVYVQALSRNRRRCMFAAGVVVDALTSLGLFYAVQTMPMHNGYKTALIGAILVKVATIIINLVPNGRYRNDGWRLLNPDSLV